MRTIAFDHKWTPVSQEDPNGVFFIDRSDDGHLVIRTERRTSHPYAFSSLIPNNSEAYKAISKFIRPIESMPHFKEAWEHFKKIQQFDAAESVEYLKDEYGAGFARTEDEITTWAKTFTACFPVVLQTFKTESFLYDGHYGLVFATGGYCDFFSAVSYREMVEKATGVWQKDVAREFKNLRLEQAQIVSYFAPYIHPNRLAEIIAESKSGRPVEILAGDFSALENLSMSVRENLLRHSLNDFTDEGIGFNMITDSLEMVDLIGSHKIFRGAKNWRDLHDRALRVAPTVISLASIEIPDNLSKLYENDDPSYKFEPLLEAGEFAALGKELNICIGQAGYFFKAIKGKTYCLKLLDGDVAVGAIELERNTKDEWVIVQLQGDSNKKLPNHDKVSEYVLETLNT